MRPWQNAIIGVVLLATVAAAGSLLLRSAGRAHPATFEERMAEYEKNKDIPGTPEYAWSQAADREFDGEYEEAKALYQEVVDLYPDSSEADMSRNSIKEMDRKISEEKAKAERNRQKLANCPLKVTRTWVTHNSIGTPEAHVVVRSVSKRTIDAYTVNLLCYDNFDQPVNDVVGGSNVFRGLVQRTVKPGASYGGSGCWTLYDHENTTKFNVRVRRVHFTDGTTWELEE